MNIRRYPFLLCALAFCFFQTYTAAEDVSAPPSLIAEMLFLDKELSSKKPNTLSPTDIIASPDGKTLYIAQHTGKRIDYINIATNQISRTIQLPKAPTGLTLSKDGSLLYVTCYSEERPLGVFCIINTAAGTITNTITAGHSPRSPVLSPDEKTLYICNQYLNSIAVFDLTSLMQSAAIPVVREPYAAAITPDGQYLVAANYLPTGRSDIPSMELEVTISAAVSIINTTTKEVVSIELSDGSHSLADIAISTDGKFAYVTHVLARYTIPPTTIERGWINSNGFSVIDIYNKKMVNVILLDDMDKGAANPWSIHVADDLILVTAAGGHELITVKESTLHQQLVGQDDLSYKFTFAQAFKQRIRLNVKGPRSVCMTGGKAYVPGYFSDNIDIISFNQGSGTVSGNVNMNPGIVRTNAQKGEELFYDGSICMQNWQTCHSCHPLTRTDGLNWDLLNDGEGNPKNDKSLLMSHFTPPSMVSGVRDSAEIAVRAGIQYILFSTPREEDAVLIDEFLKNLRPVPSPFLVNGRLSESAQRGMALFNGKFKCNDCHSAPLYTDKKLHDLGTKGPVDQRSAFDTPTLIETWRTAPYLHDGRYNTLKELFKDGKHGIYIPITDQEIDDLVEYNNSL
ncbi:MAG: cell surface protein [Fibrobacteria bacterium]|nr:cell surface protein [Fibrobacteria bacterium]